MKPNRRRQALLGSAARLAALTALSPLSPLLARVSLAQTAQTLDAPLRIVVGYAPGGASDRAVRLLAEPLRERLGVPVTVENKTGAGGRLSAQQVKAAGSDQNVLLAGNPAIMVVAPLVAAGVGYDARRDFVPVSQITRYDFGVAVGASVPVKEFNHLLAWLRANPAQANFGVPATGSLPHFFALMLGESARVSAQVVGYRGSAPLVTDLIGGQIPVAIDTLDSLIPQHQSGKLRILAVGASSRSADTLNLPTLTESGLKVVADGWNTLFAPAAMPAAKVALIGQAVEQAMRSPELQAKFRAASMVPVSSSPAQTARDLEAYRAKWEPVIRASGFRE
jgi:tripartite-type tricarboxylate transporter receptor subunit TctC